MKIKNNHAQTQKYDGVLTQGLCRFFLPLVCVQIFSISSVQAQPDFMAKVRQWREDLSSGLESKRSISFTTLVASSTSASISTGVPSNASNTDSVASQNQLSEKTITLWNQRISELDNQLKIASEPADQNLLLISKGLFLNELRRIDEAIEVFKSVKSLKGAPKLLDEYVNFYLGKIYLSQNLLKEAKLEFNQILDLSPNTKMQLETEFLLAQIALREKNYKIARQWLTKLEKRQRRQDGYDEVLYSLAYAERALQNTGPFCKWIKKLYTSYPAFERIQDWGPLLDEDRFEGAPTRCSVSNEDRRKRIKALQWSGQNEKAYKEIETLRAAVKGEEKFHVDRLEVSFWLHDGEVEKALKLLMPYYESHKNDINYLNLLANTTARAGEAQAAVGSYYKVFKLAPRGKFGKQALYQSAFLSYQFQDYDGAARKFQEFMRAFPNSGLSRDAKWHLAWIKYLRGDYQGAQKSLAEIGKNTSRGRKKSNSYPKDRVQYWTAMSLFRLGKFAEAKPIFETLAKDQSLGFYSIASQLRLKNIEEKLPKGLTRLKEEGGGKKIARFSAIEAKLPPDDLLAFRQGEGLDGEIFSNEESESEETLSLQINKAIEEVGTTGEGLPMSGETAENNSEEGAGDGVVSVDDSDSPGADVIPESRPSFSNPVLVKRFERARELMMIGLNDWAKWDLYDIERKTSNREYLRNLMQEYQLVENYNRSAYIAQTYFGAQRVLHGIEGERYLWEFAFPKAYANYVHLNAKNLNVEPELIWGIMRAESVYKKDVISPVGALGLMQVMPSTGLRLAKLMKETNFNTDKLLEPETAIKVGAFYLRRLEKKFEGYVPLVAAAYNAGPHRVLSWLSQFGTLDVDEFIEHIPYLETRNYVKKVSSYFYTYSVLYGNKRDALSYLNQPFKIALPEKSVSKESWDE